MVVFFLDIAENPQEYKPEIEIHSLRNVTNTNASQIQILGHSNLFEEK